MNHDGHACLDILVFLGSIRISTPPRPARLGERLARFCTRELAGRGHKVTLVDPLEMSLEPVFKPHFAYQEGRAPGDLGEDTDESGWRKYCARAWAQLEWWGEATRNQRALIDPNAAVKPFRSSPAQRNAP